MEGKVIYIKCSSCGKSLIVLRMNTEYEQLFNIYCSDCIETFK